MSWQNIVNLQFVENIGWSLIHSLWQISLAAFLLFVLLRILKNASANLRYLVCVAALFMAFASPLLTFLSFSGNLNQKIDTVSDELKANVSSAANKTIPGQAVIKGNSFQAKETIKIDKNDSTGMFENAQIQISEMFTNLLPYFVGIWLFGVFCFTFRFGGGLRHTHKLKTCENSTPEERWIGKFEELCEKVGINFKVNFLQSDLIECPMAIGWLKPFVIVPSSVLLGLNPLELETIIVHELIHIRRRDYLVNILQSFVEIVLFFHPLTWWISAAVRREREMSCDDEVLNIFEGAPLLYANALANLEDFRSQSNNLTPSNALAANGGNLMLRIQRIIKNAAGINRSKGSIWSAALAFSLTFVISVGLFSAIWYRHAENKTTNINNAEETTNIDAKRVAIALNSASRFIVIEDIPDADETLLLLTNNLKNRHIPVVGYANGSATVRVDNKIEREDRITAMWREAGFEIGAGLIKFPKSFDKTLADYRYVLKTQYTSSSDISRLTSSPDISRDRARMKELMARYPKPAEMSPEDRNELIQLMEKLNNESTKLRELMQNEERSWAKENNLKKVAFTINSEDWVYSNVYDSVRRSNDKKLIKYVQDRYLEYLSKIFDYYESASQDKFNRKIPQTFSLEPNRLVADSTDRILEMLQNRGYEFISMDEALKDEVFQKNYTFSGSYSFFDSTDVLSKREATEKPKPDQDIMTSWYEKKSMN